MNTTGRRQTETRVGEYSESLEPKNLAGKLRTYFGISRVEIVDVLLRAAYVFPVSLVIRLFGLYLHKF